MPMIVCLLMACGGADSGEQNGRILSDPASNADGVLRVLVFYDMEGLAGQDDWRQTLWFPPYADEYAQGRKWLTAEVNAVVAGLYAGGADEVHVVDAHGSANPTPDLLVDGTLVLVSSAVDADRFSARQPLEKPAKIRGVLVSSGQIRQLQEVGTRLEIELF